MPSSSRIGVPLLTNDLLHSITSRPIPDYQWRLEAEYWFSISLAYFQRFTVEQGTGQGATDTSWIKTTMASAKREFRDGLVI